MNNGEVVKYAKFGDVINTSLSLIVSSGLKWVMTSIDDFEVVFTTTTNINPNPQFWSSDPVDVVFYVKPKKTGQLVLRFEKKRTWEKTADPVETHEQTFIIS